VSRAADIRKYRYKTGRKKYERGKILHNDVIKAENMKHRGNKTKTRGKKNVGMTLGK
jgi:hypothetical protein